MPRVVSPTDGRLRQNRAPKIDGQTITNPGVRTQALLAQARNAPLLDTVESFVDEDTQSAGAAASVARSGHGRLPVYKLTPGGCVRIEVNVQSVHELLSRPHYSAVCFDCNRDDCLYETSIRGEVSTNQCAGKPSRMYRVCPETMCSKRIYDPLPTGSYLKDEFDHSDRKGDGDVNRIGGDDYASTPEMRTKAMMDIHIIGFHPAKAMELGVGARPELPKLAVV